MIRDYRVFSGILLSVLTCVLPARAQQPQQPPAQALRIIGLEGNGAINYIPIRTATAPVIEVRDQNDHPVEGAKVVFTLPSSGPGAVFENNQTTYTTITDFRGQAGTKGYTGNDKPGKFVIDVTATYQDLTGRLVMTQVNSMELPPSLTGEKSSRRRRWVWIGIAAAAATGVGVYFGTRDNSSPISVSTGPVVIGGPR